MILVVAGGLSKAKRNQCSFNKEDLGGREGGRQLCSRQGLSLPYLPLLRSQRQANVLTGNTRGCQASPLATYSPPRSYHRVCANRNHLQPSSHRAPPSTNPAQSDAASPQPPSSGLAGRQVRSNALKYSNYSLITTCASPLTS